MSELKKTPEGWEVKHFDFDENREVRNTYDKRVMLVDLLRNEEGVQDVLREVTRGKKGRERQKALDQTVHKLYDVMKKEFEAHDEIGQDARLEPERKLQAAAQFAAVPGALVSGGASLAASYASSLGVMAADIVATGKAKYENLRERIFKRSYDSRQGGYLSRFGAALATVYDSVKEGLELGAYAMLRLGTAHGEVALPGVMHILSDRVNRSELGHAGEKIYIAIRNVVNKLREMYGLNPVYGEGSEHYKPVEKKVEEQNKESEGKLHAKIIRPNFKKKENIDDVATAA